MSAPTVLIVILILAIAGSSAYLILSNDDDVGTIEEPVSNGGSIPTKKEDTYIKFAGLDSNAGDIRQMKDGSIQDLKVACSKDSSCKAFNAWGWMKKDLKGVGQWHANEDSAIYVKSKFAPPGITSGVAGVAYAIYPGKDSYGNDIRKVSGGIAEVQMECSKDSSCRGFTNEGWIKHSLKPKGDWGGFPKDTLYVKK